MPDLSFCTMDGWVDVLFLVRVLVMTDELLLVVGNQSNTDVMPFFFHIRHDYASDFFFGFRGRSGQLVRIRMNLSVTLQRYDFRFVIRTQI